MRVKGKNMKNIEIEYKVLINKNDFNKLEQILNEYEHYEKIQINYYYDTKNNNLKNKGLSLRIRHLILENTYLVTLKEKIKDGHIEYEQYINSLEIKNISNEILNILIKNNIELTNLQIMAFLKTIRKEFHFDDKLLCLDHNYYYNNEDYEIECEAKSLLIASNFIKTLLEKNNIKYKENFISKQQRAIQAKGQ